jgi:hypothetical protein
MLVLLSNEFPKPLLMISTTKIVLSLLLLAVLTAMTVTSPLYVIAANEKSEQAKDNGNGNSDDNEEDTTDSSDQETEEVTEAAQDPTPGVGNNDNELGQDNPQPDRVGSHDDQTSGEGANAGGTVTDPTICSVTDNPECETTISANCFGKVIQHEAQEHKEEGSDEGTLGTHSRDPVPELEGNETPRQGIGNQNQGHPASHGGFNAQFEDEDEENVIENC